LFGADHPIGFGVIQRVMKKRVEDSNYVFADGGARFESTNNRGEGKGRKPLLVIPTKTDNVDLHVHLIPVDPPKALTGWNLKETLSGKHLIKDNSTQPIDQEDIGLFNDRAAGWNVKGSYPRDVFWANESESDRALRGEQVFAKRRQQYVEYLNEKLENHVKQRLKREPVTLTLQFSSRGRKNKGETHSQFVEFVDKAKPLPVLDGVQAKRTIADSGEYKAVFRFSTHAEFETHHADILAKMKEGPANGTTWTFGSATDSATAVEQSIRTKATDHVAEVEQGDHDDKVRSWSGERREVSFD